MQHCEGPYTQLQFQAQDKLSDRQTQKIYTHLKFGEERSKEMLELKQKCENSEKEVNQWKLKVQEIISANKEWETYANTVQAKFVESQAKLEAQDAELEQLRHVLKELQTRNQGCPNCILKDQRIRALQKENEFPEKTQQANQSEAEIVKLLQEQIRVCTEDFNAERRDREVGQAKILEQQELIKQYKANIEQLQDQLRAATRSGTNIRQRNNTIVDHGQHVADELQTDGDFPCFDDDVTYLGPQYHPGHQTQRMVNREQMALMARGQSNQISSKIHRMSENNYYSNAVSLDDFQFHTETSGQRLRSRGQDVADGVGNPEFGAPDNTKDIMHCPKCWKEYTSDQHFELLEHIDVCCD